MTAESSLMRMIVENSLAMKIATVIIVITATMKMAMSSPCPLATRFHGPWTLKLRQSLLVSSSQKIAGWASASVP